VRRRAIRLGALCSALVSAGCAVSQPDFPVRRYLAGDLVHVRDFAAREAVDGDVENLALVLNVQGQCELALGDVEAARRSLERAAQIMGNWSTGGGEAAAAILGSESSKTYKGDPYEKAMNAFYLSVSYLLRGEPDNARAALKRGILADAEVGDERYQADNALLFWMAGRMSRLMGSPDADDFFREAREAHAFALRHGARGDAVTPVLADPTRGNVVLLLPIGLGPEKYREGGWDELARFRSRPHAAAGAMATVGGRSLGPAWILTDVDYQARTLGGTAMEGIREGKAVFKTATTVSGLVLLNQAGRHRGEHAQAMAITGGALLLVGLLTSSAADVRHWPTLPSTVQVLVADLPPGHHEIEVDFLDVRGRPLPNLRRRVLVDVPATGESWLFVPSLPSAGARP
jgi:tetratricopeptide (TPR) repeat protein